MPFAADNFTLSKQNKTCQDYSIAGTDPFPYAIICDGCSSAIRSEIGSHILPLLAKNILISRGNILEKYMDTEAGSFETIFRIVLHDALHNIYYSLKPAIKNDNFHSTLLLSFLFSDPGIFATLMYGDGFVKVTLTNGETKIFKLSFSSNAPFYFIYFLNQDLLDSFNDMNQTIVLEELVSGSKQELNNPENVTKFIYESSQVESLFIFSDGVDSFFNTTTREKIPAIDIINMITVFNNTKGQFLARRFISPLGLVNHFRDNNISWSDDISVAGFIRKD